MRDLVLFYALLALLAIRPLIGETFEPLDVSLITALQASGGPTPATTAWIDALQLTLALLVLPRAAPQAWRCARGRAAAVGLVLLPAAVIISAQAAGDRPLALLAGLNLVIMALGGAALAALCRERGRQRLVLAALLATAATTALKCVNQRLVENPQTRQQWEQVYRPALLGQGFEPDDPLFVNFERRMRAGETYGFQGHPNLTGSILMTAGVACAGVLLASVAARRHGPAALLALLLATIAAAIWFTGSLGAVLAGVLALVVLAALGLLARQRARPERSLRPAPLVALLAAAYLAVIAGGTAWGAARGTLPHASLAFRWQYWTAAARAYRDVPLTGLGRENFAAAYTRHKAAASTEEVRNPHNLWVTLLVELGPLGLLAGALLAGAAVSRPVAGVADATRRAAAGDRAAEAPRPTWRAALPLVATGLLVHVVCSAASLGQPGATYLWVTDVGLPWSFALLLLNHVLPDAPERSPWVNASLAAALFAALVHGLLDFALTTPAGLAAFVLALAASNGPVTREPCPENASNRGQRGSKSLSAALACGAALIIGGAYLAWITIPATRSAAHFRALHVALQPPSNLAALAAAANAASSEATDPALQRAAAGVLLRASPHVSDAAERRAWLEAARAAAERAVAANPQAAESHALLATVLWQLAADCMRAGEDPAARAWRGLAVEQWGRALDCYPTNPRLQLSAGLAWAEVFRLEGEAGAAAAARKRFEAALRIDDLRAPGEAVRLRPAERRAAEQGLADVGPTATSRAGEPPEAL